MEELEQCLSTILRLYIENDMILQDKQLKVEMIEAYKHTTVGALRNAIITYLVEDGHEHSNNCHCAVCFEYQLMVYQSTVFPIMHLCPDCGNKRCPKASYHGNDCSNSNVVNQLGSFY